MSLPHLPTPVGPPVVAPPVVGAGGDPCAPHNLRWQPVSSRLIPVRLVAIWLTLLLFAAPFLILGITVDSWFFLGAAVLALLGLWLSYLVPRQVHAMGYAETPDEFIFRRGVLFQRLTIVPYGRMQYVDISRGPIARYFGIAELKLHTAAAATDLTINGLPEAETNRLRVKLTELGEAKLAGL